MRLGDGSKMHYGRRMPTPLRLAPCALISRRIVLACAVLCAALPLVACGPERPVGDAKGGVIDWFASTRGQVLEAATAHCARYGKTARLTNTERDRSGGHAVFICE